MLECFTSQPDGAIPITPIREADLPEWLAAHPQSREWLAAWGFKAEPGTFAFVGGTGGRPGAVLAGRAEGEAIWSLAGLPAALPEGTYALSGDAEEASVTEAALGWALGSYAFTRYRKAKRAPATLVWPAKADRAEVERVAA